MIYQEETRPLAARDIARYFQAGDAIPEKYCVSDEGPFPAQEEIPQDGEGDLSRISVTRWHGVNCISNEKKNTKDTDKKALRFLRLGGKEILSLMVHSHPRNPRSRRLLVTTNTEENAIAPAASIGLISPSAAAGMRTTL
jgi:hypothetical protein